MEGALLAAMALRHLGFPPLLVDLEAVRDSDHVLAVYRVNGRWGALAKSDYAGLRSREPVYSSVRELVLSYFEHYYNAAGEKTLRAYSRPVNLARFDRSFQGCPIQWMTTFDDVWDIPEHLVVIAHTRILTKPMERSLARMDRQLYEAGRVGGVCAPLLDLSRVKKPGNPMCQPEACISIGRPPLPLEQHHAGGHADVTSDATCTPPSECAPENRSAWRRVHAVRRPSAPRTIADGLVNSTWS